MGFTSMRKKRLCGNLKAGVKTGEEGMVGGEGEDPLLCHGALHVVVLDDHVLLQNLETDTDYYKKAQMQCWDL
jgi:hypothetical protein